jgi:hypothetical protein
MKIAVQIRKHKYTQVLPEREMNFFKRQTVIGIAAYITGIIYNEFVLYLLS